MHRIDRCCAHSPSLPGGRHSGVETKRGHHMLCRLAEERSAHVLLSRKRPLTLCNVPAQSRRKHAQQRSLPLATCMHSHVHQLFTGRLDLQSTHDPVAYAVIRVLHRSQRKFSPVSVHEHLSKGMHLSQLDPRRRMDDCTQWFPNRLIRFPRVHLQKGEPGLAGEGSTEESMVSSSASTAVAAAVTTLSYYSR